MITNDDESSDNDDNDGSDDTAANSKRLLLHESDGCFARVTDGFHKHILLESFIRISFCTFREKKKHSCIRFLL